MSITLMQASVGTAAGLAVPVLAFALQAPALIRPQVPVATAVEIAEQMLDFQAPGEFLVGGRQAAVPVQRQTVGAFHIMAQQVGLADYGRCVAAGVCIAPDARPTVNDIPVTGVSFLDAEAYARWYSVATGGTWRLPTALEAAAAAGERFYGEPLSTVAEDPRNPALRWIRQYREEAAAKRPRDSEPKRRGHYGPNTLGVEDVGGNVWEWTSTCYSRHSRPALGGGGAESIIENCGVRVLAGRHRAYLSDFVRNAKSGGCAVGTPPDNLGFRLVAEKSGSPANAVLAVLRLTLPKVVRR